MSRKNLLTTALILLCIQFWGASACTQGSLSAEGPTPTPIPTSIIPVKPTYTVQRGDLTTQVQFTGRVVPALIQAVSFQMDGRVKDVYVEGGESVQTGQLLAALDTLEALKQQKASDQLNVRRSEVLLKIAQLRLEQAQARIPSAASIGPEYEIAQKEVTIQENQVELAQISLEEAKLKVQELDRTIAASQILAPFDGKVLFLKSGVPGTRVEAYETLVTVGDVSSLKVSANLEASLMSRLTEGQPLLAVPENRPGQEIAGDIERLPYPYGSGGQGEAEGNDAILISLDTDLVEAGFTVGDTLQITVVLDHKENVLWLPPQAVRTFEGRKFAVVQDGEVQRRVDVKIGMEGVDRVEILDGLSEGQVVVSP